MRVILSCQPLQEKEGLLEHAQQILFKVHWHTVLRYQFIDAGHSEHTESGAVHLAALTLLSVSPSPVRHRQHIPGVKLSIRRVGGDEGSRLGFRVKVTTKTCKMENGCQQRGCDVRGERDPAEQVGQTLQHQTTELLTLTVQRRHGLAEQLWILAALEQTAQQLHW